MFLACLALTFLFARRPEAERHSGYFEVLVQYVSVDSDADGSAHSVNSFAQSFLNALRHDAGFQTASSRVEIGRSNRRFSLAHSEVEYEVFRGCEVASPVKTGL